MADEGLDNPSELVDEPTHGTDDSLTTEPERPLFANNGRILLAACVAGDELLVRALIKLGTNLDTKSQTGLSPLVVAVVNGHLTIVKLLLQGGASVCMRSVIPAITLAGKMGRPGIVTELLGVIGSTNLEFASASLVYAIAEGCPITVAELLRLRADPNTTTETGLQPLIVASERGQPDIAKLLIEAGASVHWASGSQLTPLAVAARNGHPEVVQLLLDAGPTIDAVDTALVFAGKMGHASVVDILVCGGIKMFPKFGPSALRLAVMDGCELVTSRLIEAGTNVDDRSPKGLTAILAASERGMEGAVQQLLAAKADLSGMSDGGLTPLVVASVNGHEGVVGQLLAAGADISSPENISAIVLAGKHGHRGVVARLVKSGALRKSDFYSFALLFAIAEGCTSTVEFLVHAGADVNEKNKDGTTALMAASERGCAGVVHMLLKAGAHVNATAYNLTALAVASRNGHHAVVKHLLDAGADLSTFDTALLFAAKNSHAMVVEEIVKAGHQKTYVPEIGKSTFCEEALRLAISSNCTCAVECLLRYGAAVDDGISPPPLMIASERGLVEVVKLLLDAQADPNSCTDNGLSAMVVAAVNGHYPTVLQLLTAGAKVAIGDNIQAVVLAGKYGHAAVVDLLVTAGLQEGADFSKALLSAIVDDCKLVVGRLLLSGACSATADNDMPLRLAFHQNRSAIVALLIAAKANLNEAQLHQQFGSNLQLLAALQVVAYQVAGQTLPEGAEGSKSTISRALHLHDETTDLEYAVWWGSQVQRVPCFLPLCPGIFHVRADAFSACVARLKPHPDLPSIADVLTPILCHAAFAWHERFHHLLPLNLKRLVRSVVLAWSERRAMPGLAFDLLRVVFSYCVHPDLLDYG